MMTDSNARSATPSVHVVRARKLLLGGLAGGVVATVAAILGLGLLYGRPGLIAALLAAAMVLFFYTVGQWVMVMFADAGARTLMAVSMASYTMRVAVLGLVLLAYNQNSDAWPALEPKAVFIATIVVVVGWLAAEILVFTRLRISVYDEPTETTREHDSSHPTSRGGGA